MKIQRFPIQYFTSQNKAITQNNNIFDFMKPSYAKLTNRTIIIVHGQQTKKFLQQLTCNNLSQLYDTTQTKTPLKIALYTFFINQKAKIITDAFIIKPQIHSQKNMKQFMQNQLWIDVQKSKSANLIQYLRRPSQKKNITIRNLDYQQYSPSLYAGFFKIQSSKIYQKINQMSLSIPQYGCQLDISIQQQQKQLQNHSKKQSQKPNPRHQKKVPNEIYNYYANAGFYDPRGLKFGIRIISGYNQFKIPKQAQQSTLQQYQKSCILNGSSSSSVMNNYFPFMFNADFFHGISFKKGSFLGKQAISTLYHTGIVKRRIFPFVLDIKDKILQPKTILHGEKNRILGQVMESGAGYGTILCNYIPLLSLSWPLKIQQPVKGQVRMPFQQQLRKYVSDAKARKNKPKEVDM